MAQEQNKERKTKDLVQAKEITHFYEGKPMGAVYIVGEVKQGEHVGKDGKTVYFQEFRGSFKKPEDPSKVDFAKSGAYHCATTEKFSGLEAHRDAMTPVYVTGQTFKEPYKGKDGKDKTSLKTYVRSLKEVVVEKGEDGKEHTKGGADIMPASIAVKNDINAVERTNLNGFINYAKLNSERKDKDGNVFAYNQFMLIGYVDKDTKERKTMRVAFNTKEPLDASFAPQEVPGELGKNGKPKKKGKRVSMLGVVHVADVFKKAADGGKGHFEKEETFEPVYIGEFIEKAMDLEAAAKTKAEAETAQVEKAQQEVNEAEPQEDEIPEGGETFAFPEL